MTGSSTTGSRSDPHPLEESFVIHRWAAEQKLGGLGATEEAFGFGRSCCVSPRRLAVDRLDRRPCYLREGLGAADVGHGGRDTRVVGLGCGDSSGVLPHHLGNLEPQSQLADQIRRPGVG